MNLNQPSTQNNYRGRKTMKFKDISKRFAAAIKRDGWSGRVLPEYGTASILANTDASRALPTRNARQGSFEGADRINGDAVADTIRRRGGKTTHKGCSWGGENHS